MSHDETVPGGEPSEITNGALPSGPAGTTAEEASDNESVPPPPSGRQKLVFGLLAATLVLVVTLGLGEVLARSFFRYNTPDTVRAASLQYRPSTFTRHLLVPDQEVFPDRAWGDPPGEGGGAGERRYRINNLGYRGPDLEIPKPAKTCRLVVLGGSAVFDIGATEGADWPRRLEGRLRQAETLPEGHTFEVINAGVPGHTSSDAVGKLYAQLWQAEPDAVLLYNAWNDIKSFTELAPDRPLVSLVEPHNPTADPFQNYRGPIDRLLGHSQLYIKLRNRYYLWQYDVGLEGRKDDRPLADVYSPLGPVQYRLDVVSVVTISRAIGAHPLLATQASLVTRQASDEARQRIAYGYQGLSHDALVRAIGECNDAIRQVAVEHAVPLIDLDHRFSGRPELFDDHVHTSAAGSAALAEAVADFLAPRLATLCGVDAQPSEDGSETGSDGAASGETVSGEAVASLVASLASSAPASQPSP